MAAPDELLKPIPGDNPGGEDLRYESVYDDLKEARRADDDIPQGEWQTDRKVADYGQVIKLASDILANKSKDLQVAAWLTEAWLAKDGLGGLADGLDLLRGILDGFWDHCYPEIEDDDLEFRAAPLEWVGLRLDIPVKSVPLTARGYGLIEYQEAKALGYEEDLSGDEEKLEARKAAIAEGKLALEEFDEGFEATPKAWYKTLVADLVRSQKAVEALDQVGRDRFGPDAPGYRGLLGALDEVSRAAKQFLAKKLELDPDPIEEQTEDDAAMAMDAGTGDVPIEPTSPADAASRVAAAARFLQRADPTNPASYLMLRGFRWGELRSHGGELDPKQLAAPPTQIRTRLKGFLLDGKWAELLAAAEGVMASAHGRGWLDLQRYVLTACSHLGSEYDNVAQSIRGALASLLHDVPDLVSATLMDDTPTANAETRAWLRTELAGVEAAPTPEVPAEEAEGRPVVQADGKRTRDAFDRAMMEVRAGRPERGVEVLMREVSQEKSERAKFLRRAQMAGIMVEAGMEQVALPILRDLLQLVENHQLETWEAGETVARPLSLLQRCLVNIEGESEQARELYLRVCRLDPMQAMVRSKPPEAPAPEPASSGDGADES